MIRLLPTGQLTSEPNHNCPTNRPGQYPIYQKNWIISKTYVAHSPVGVGKLPANLIAKGQDPNQASLVWLLQFADHIIPIPGTSNPQHLIKNMEALLLAEAPLV